MKRSRAFLDVPDTHVRVMKGNALKGESDERINEATADDESMQKLLSIILDSWRDNKNEVPSELKPYFDMRDTLSHQHISVTTTWWDALAILYFGQQCHMRYHKWPKTVKPTQTTE